MPEAVNKASTSRGILFCETCWSHEKQYSCWYHVDKNLQWLSCENCGQKTLISDLMDLRISSLLDELGDWNRPPKR